MVQSKGITFHKAAQPNLIWGWPLPVLKTPKPNEAPSRCVFHLSPVFLQTFLGEANVLGNVRVEKTNSDKSFPGKRP